MSTVRASHILVKHKGSRRPSSWKEPNITRSKEEAIEILKGHREAVVSGKETFAAVAERESACSSHSSGGDLGVFGYALKVGEISEIVDTDSGVHIILRTA